MLEEGQVSCGTHFPMVEPRRIKCIKGKLQLSHNVTLVSPLTDAVIIGLDACTAEHNCHRTACREWEIMDFYPKRKLVYILLNRKKSEFGNSVSFT